MNRKISLIMLLSTTLMAFSFPSLFEDAKPNYKIVKDLNTTQQRSSEAYIKSVHLQNRLPAVLEKEAIFVLNEFIHTLQNNNFKDSAYKVVPLMHKSLLTPNGKKLDDDMLRFSFKKAHSNAKNYAYPVEITRIDRLKTTEIGHGNNSEVGIEFKMWIAKKSEQGYDAPLVLFFKQNGSNEAKLSYVGSI